MYERNAIVLERYFNKLFGYDDENNLKNNYRCYVDLVNSLEKYIEASVSEDKIMVEYEDIASAIKSVQKEQKILFNKNIKLQNDRNNLFTEIGENADDISKKINIIEKELEENENAIRNVSKKFIEDIREFNEKIETRTKYETENRIIETGYKKNLDASMDVLSSLNMEKVKYSKAFYEQDNIDIIEEIKKKILKNGEKERVKFDLNVINKSIQTMVDINKREVECFNDIFDKTGKLFAEINEDNVKIEKHKKTIRDIKAKLEFLSAQKDYIVLFLDNERLNVMSGEKEHHKLMDEACKYFELDLKQIENLYELLQKEISGKSTKKAFKDLYNIEYLYDLDNKQREFEFKVSKFNLMGTIINPDYWRIEGIRKIYDVFKNIMNDVFDKDLSEYEYKQDIPMERVEEVKEEEIQITPTESRVQNKYNDEVKKEQEQEEIKNSNSENEAEEENEEEIRKKRLEKILAFINNEADSIDYEEIVNNKKDKKEKQIVNEKHNESQEIKEGIKEDYDEIDENEEIFEEEDFDFDFDDDFEEEIFDSEDNEQDTDNYFEDDYEDNNIDFNDEELDDTWEDEQNVVEEDEDIIFEDDDFEDDTDFDFEDDDEDLINEQLIEVDEDEEEEKEEKKKTKKSKKDKKNKKEDIKDKEEKKGKKKNKGKEIVKKIKKMSQTENDIKNMWTE